MCFIESYKDGWLLTFGKKSSRRLFRIAWENFRKSFKSLTASRSFHCLKPYQPLYWLHSLLLLEYKTSRITPVLQSLVGNTRRQEHAKNCPQIPVCNNNKQTEKQKELSTSSARVIGKHIFCGLNGRLKKRSPFREKDFASVTENRDCCWENWIVFQKYWCYRARCFTG